MSYILDALRQSERQRRQARPPYAHNRQMTPDGHQAVVTTRRWPMLLMLFILIALGTGYGLGVIGGKWLQQDRISSRMEDQPEPPATPIIVAPEAPTAPSLPELARLKIRLDEPPVSQITVEPPVDTKQRKAQQTPVTPGPESLFTSAITTPEPAPAEQSQDPGIMDLRQLPSAIQARLPPLSLSVHIYSANAEHRMVKINDRMLREGQSISPELQLKSITPLGVILNFEGNEFHMKSVGG